MAGESAAGNARLLGAVQGLRSAVSEVSLPFDLPGVRAAERSTRSRLLGSSTTTSSRASRRSTRPCSPWSADRPAPASPRWSTPSWWRWSALRACSARPRGRRSSCTTPTTSAGSPRRDPPGPRAGHGRQRGRGPGDHAAGHLVDPAAGARAARRPRHRLRRPRATVSWPASCSVRPTCGSSSRRRPGMRMRCPGSCSARRRNAGPRWPSCSTGSPRARSPSSESTSGRCSRSRASAPLRSSRWRSRRSRSTACCRTTRWPGCTRGSRRWPRTRVPALSWSARR